MYTTGKSVESFFKMLPFTHRHDYMKSFCTAYSIIIGEYRTVILRSKWDNPDITQRQALRAVTVSALVAALVAVVVCASIGIPLAILSRDFDDRTAKLIEGGSKIIAAICLLQLSLKMPKFFGLYYSKAQLKKIKNGELIENGDDSPSSLTQRSIRFNVSWNIWREVAECGVFLIPFFLTGEGIISIPLSALVGSVVGGSICLLIYYANKHFRNTVGLTAFTVSLFLLLSTGLFAGGCNKFEMVFGSTTVIWEISGDFWSVDRLPMTVFKPFGYSDTRTVLQIVAFWGWLSFGLVLHYLKYKRCRKPPVETPSDFDTGPIVSLPTAGTTVCIILQESNSKADETIELSESSRSGNEEGADTDSDLKV
jgi:high-affinity iron transporter